MRELYLSESELEEEAPAAAAAAWRQQQRQGGGSEGGDLPPIVEKLAAQPLELASELSKLDAHYLEKRNRKRWWSRSEFPRVPPPTEADKHPPRV